MARAGGGRTAAKPTVVSSGPAGAGAGLWWGGLGCGATVVLSPATAILLAALLSPVLLVTLVPEDGVGQRPGRRIVLASLLVGLATSVSPLCQLWNAGPTISTATSIAHRPMVLLATWTAIGGGWFVGEAAGIVLKLTADLGAAARRRTCAAELAALEAEWGPLSPMAGPPPG